jgi:hypothetical protein
LQHCRLAGFLSLLFDRIGESLLLLGIFRVMDCGMNQQVSSELFPLRTCLLFKSIPLTSTKIYSLMVILAQARISTRSLIDICATCLGSGGPARFTFLTDHKVLFTITDSCRVRVAVRPRPKNAEDLAQGDDFDSCVGLQPEVSLSVPLYLLCFTSSTNLALQK